MPSLDNIDPVAFDIPDGKALLYSDVENEEIVYKYRLKSGTTGTIDTFILDAFNLRASQLPVLVDRVELFKCLNNNFVTPGELAIAVSSKADIDYVKKSAATKLSKSEFAIRMAQTPTNTEMEDALSSKADHREMVAALDGKADKSSVYNKETVDQIITEALVGRTVVTDSITVEGNGTDESPVSITNGVKAKIEETHNWVVQNAPSVQIVIDQTHEHDNKSTLDKFSESDGMLVFNGSTISGREYDDTAINLRVDGALDRIDTLEQSDVRNINMIVFEGSTIAAVNKTATISLPDTLATKTYVATAISHASHLKVEVVESTDEVTDPNKIYLIASTDPADDDIYDEYMLIDGTVERIGSTKISLDNIEQAISDLQSTTASLLEFEQRVDTEFINVNATFTEHSNAIAENNSNISILGNTVSTLSSQLSDTNNAVQQNASDIDAVESSVAAINTEMTEFSSTLVTLHENILTVSQDVHDNTADITTAKNNITSLTERVTLNETNIAQSASQITTLESNVANLNTATSALQDRVGAVESGKQAKLTGEAGQYVTFDENGNAVAGTIEKDDPDYCTAFEVYAHNTRIVAGNLDGQSHAEYIGKPGDVIAFSVNPSMTESFKLRSEQSKAEQDVVVEWGDGTTTNVADIDPEVLSGEYRYTLSHTYSETGTYIVKIYGKTYFSFTSSGSETTSLISRVFDRDLPIAPHIWNLSSAFQHSNRLLHVNMYSHEASHQITHWSGGFTSARNLIDCYGFSKYAHRESNYNIFQNCINLVGTDLRIAGAPVDISTGNGYAFTNCPKLTGDVDSFLPSQGFKAGSKVNIARLFKGDVSITGTVPADKLWNNHSVTWYNTSEAFLNCSDEIRNQVPQSWGGLADDSIITSSDTDRIRILENEFEFESCTAFEVFAHDYDIAIGQEVPALSDSYVPEGMAIPSSMTHKMLIRSGSIDTASSDIVIDWGDQSARTVIANGDYTEKTEDVAENEAEYLVEHTYTANGKYIVRIFGSKYFAIRTPDISTADRFKYNLICRVFDYDLPIAKNLNNLSSFASYAPRLLSAIIPSYYAFPCTYNINSLFRECRNLKVVKGLNNRFPVVYSAASIFYNDISLSSCDFNLPVVTSGNVTGAYRKCTSLGNDIATLIPAAGFVGTIDAANLFRDCPSLTGTVPADQFWNNQNVKWLNTSSAFSGCSAEIREQVPQSWGGTASDDIIEKSDKELINDLRTEVEDSYYTAFEVWPNSSSYAKDSVLPNIYYFKDPEKLHPMSGKTVNYPFAADSTEKFKIRSYNTPDTIDVVVDWGDGSQTKLSDLTPSASIPDTNPPEELAEYTYECTHTYDIADKVYVVKVYGKKYFGMQHLYNDYSGLLCGCFGKDLPLAPHLNNLAGFAGRSTRLFQVELSEYIQNAQIVSLSNTFLGCENLEYAIGFARLTNNLYNVQQCFGSCGNMTFCDFRIPGNTITPPKKNPYKGTFSYCKKLRVDILTLLPANGFYGDEAMFGGLFNTCPLVTCSDYDKLAKMLWNNKHVHWIDAEVSPSSGFLAAFRGCSAELRSHVPSSWGGTASDDIIEPSLEEELANTKAELETVKSKLTQVINALGLN